MELDRDYEGGEGTLTNPGSSGRSVEDGVYWTSAPSAQCSRQQLGGKGNFRECGGTQQSKPLALASDKFEVVMPKKM